MFYIRDSCTFHNSQIIKCLAPDLFIHGTSIATNMELSRLCLETGKNFECSQLHYTDLCIWMQRNASLKPLRVTTRLRSQATPVESSYEPSDKQHKVCTHVHDVHMSTGRREQCMLCNDSSVLIAKRMSLMFCKLHRTLVDTTTVYWESDAALTGRTHTEYK